jgi:acetyl-CoA carboxylase biotin carboxyl carrier protein
MDINQIRELLQIVAESSVAEVEIEEKKFKLTIRKQAPQVIMQSAAPAYPPQMPYAPQPMPAPVAAPAPVVAAAPVVAEAPQAAVAAAADEHIVRAPIVGTFYAASGPDAADYVKVGDSVTEGQTLCIIEAMKLMNQIEADATGTITKILVQNASPVEYDQPLFVISK